MYHTHQSRWTINLPFMTRDTSPRQDTSMPNYFQVAAFVYVLFFHGLSPGLPGNISLSTFLLCSGSRHIPSPQHRYAILPLTPTLDEKSNLLSVQRRDGRRIFGRQWPLWQVVVSSCPLGIAYHPVLICLPVVSSCVAS